MLRIYDRYVAGAPTETEKEQARFEIIFGVTLHGGEPYILASTGRAVDDVGDFATRGTGSFLSDYIIRQWYDPLTLTLPQVAVGALQFLSAAKRHCESVSGPSQFLTICKGSMTDVISREFGRAEERIEQYEQATGRLLFHLGNVLSDDIAFSGNLDRFSKDVTAIRSQWKSDSEWLTDFLKKLCL